MEEYRFIGSTLLISNARNLKWRNGSGALMRFKGSRVQVLNRVRKKIYICHKKTNVCFSSIY